jgi:single-strand DNA-binding protein
MLNEVKLIGRVGKAPEVRHVNDKAVANFSLATSEKYKDKEYTQWHNIEIWGRLAEIVGEYLEKGTLVFISGQIIYQSWGEGKDKKYKTVIRADKFKMLSKKNNQKVEDKPEDDIPF